LTEPVPFARWAATLEAALAGRWSVRAIESCPSTQDQACGEPVGTVVVAWRQTAGRGRLGRSWIDGAADGVAMTAVLPSADPARLSIASGVAVANALESLVRDGGEDGIEPAPRIRIKWPNDVQLDGRKVAGVLVETTGDRALIGIGINVTQRRFPEELRRRAASLAGAGIEIDRVEVMSRTLRRLGETLTWPTDRLRAEFARLDALVGTRRAVRVGELVHDGTILAIDPFASIQLRRDDGTVVELPTAHAQLVAP